MNEFKYNIGYALSGGFIKGFAHLGIMQALHEHGIRPEILSGVSLEESHMAYTCRPASGKLQQTTFNHAF